MTVIEQPRHFCALAGQQSVSAIPGAIPIVHAGPGCCYKLMAGLGGCSGHQGAGYSGGSGIPCTNSGEREVVFGGEQRLREVIGGALKIMESELFVVLTGCTSDLVGDDTVQVVKEYQDQGIPIVCAETGGFKGNSYLGHELVLEAIIEQYLEPAAEIQNGLVNIWSSVPYQDPFWRGNLETIRQLLAGIGLSANILFGPGAHGPSDWKLVSSAQFNLVLSPWVGIKAARLLESRFGTPYLHYPVVPIGARQTSLFLREIGRFAGVPEPVVDEYVREQEEHFYLYMENSADFLLEFRYDLPGRFFNVSDSFYTLGITSFLVNELGLLPGRQYITDEPPAGWRPELVRALDTLAPGISSEVVFCPDGGIIQADLKAYPHQHHPLIIGSDWEKDLARDLRGFLLAINPPLTHRLVLDRSYLGYRGGLRLAEDIFASVLATYP